MTDSHKFLRHYAETGSEPAFRELVMHYIDLVYSIAVRLMQGDTHRAEDVTQTVFTDLARTAATLSPNVILGGWLHRRTCHVAATVLRSERRRRFRERQAVEMNALQDHSESNLAQISPILDDAINQLGAEDRMAILLRFFEHNDFRTIGQALGTNEDAAQKRVTRALEKLHLLLKRRGVAFSAAALATALATEAVTAAPAGLALNISGLALAGVAAGTGGATVTLLKILTMTKLKVGIISAIAVMGVATPLVIQYQTQAKLRDENTSLKQQVAEQAQLAQENQHLSNQLAEVKSVGLLSEAQRSELMRLRGEVGALRNQKPPSTQSRKASAPPSKSPAQLQDPLPAPTVPLLPVESWANVGTATPESSWQTLRWAFTRRDTQAFSQTVAWDPEIKTKAAEVFDAAPESARQKFGSVEGVLYAMMMTPGFSEQNVTGFGVASQSVSGDDATLIVQEQHNDGVVRQNPIQLHHFDDGWRIITPPKMVDVLGRYLNNPQLWVTDSTGNK
jgi:RNA polymerase sigma factor (sigma-70 family)